MQDILIRRVEDDVARVLKERAKRNRRSLQAELRLILDDVVRRDAARTEAIDVMHRIREELKHIPQTDSARLIRDGRKR